MTDADRSAPAPSARQAILGHAAACFDRYGIHRTRMGDIAAEAGISRQALYRLFPNRQAVIDGVLVMHAEVLIEQVAKEVSHCETFAEMLLEGCVHGITFLREKPDILRLAYESNVAEVSKSLLRPSTAPLALSVELWQPMIDRGRERGEVRPDLDDQDFIEWISTINLMYAMRDDIPTDRLRTLLRRHLLPGAVAGAEKLVPPLAEGTRPD